MNIAPPPNKTDFPSSLALKMHKFFILAFHVLRISKRIVNTATAHLSGLVRKHSVSNKWGSADLMHALPQGCLDLHFGLIVNPCRPCVEWPGSNLPPERGDAVIWLSQGGAGK